MTLYYTHIYIFWKYGNMEIWKYGNMEIWKYGNMEIWKYGNMEINPYKYIYILEIWKSTPINIYILYMLSYNNPKYSW